MSASDHLGQQFAKDDRVRHPKTGKLGTIVRDPHETLDGGMAAYVRWDGSTRPPLPTGTDNLRRA